MVIIFIKIQARPEKRKELSQILLAIVELRERRLDACMQAFTRILITKIIFW